jgi:hypothetical protein
MSDIPAVAVAEHTMIPTTQFVTELDRNQTQKDLQEILSREDVKKALLERGVSPDEISSRLASLSDSDLRQLSGQIQQARAGGDILVAILLIVLIIFLIKRI